MRIIFCLLLASSVSRADGLFVEPLIGYEAGTFDNGFSTPANFDKGPAGGLFLGGMLAYQFLDDIFVGADYRHVWGRFRDEDSLNPKRVNDRSTHFSIAGTVGGRLPFLRELSLWFSYIFHQQVFFKNPNASTPFQKFSGSAIRFGLGYRLLTFIKLNVEYIHYTHKTFEDQSGKYNLPLNLGDTLDLSQSAFIFSLSAPLYVLGEDSDEY